MFDVRSSLYVFIPLIMHRQRNFSNKKVNHLTKPGTARMTVGHLLWIGAHLPRPLARLHATNSKHLEVTFLCAHHLFL